MHGKTVLVCVLNLVINYRNILREKPPSESHIHRVLGTEHQSNTKEIVIALVNKTLTDLTISGSPEMESFGGSIQ